MIRYKSGGIHFILRLGQMTGSVFPAALLVALPCSAIAVVLRILATHPDTKDDFGFVAESTSILTGDSAWSGFTALVGFLTIFRTSQAYSRFWEGNTSIHRMRSEWWFACASLISCLRISKAPRESVLACQHKLIRLFSLLHVVAMGDIEDLASPNVEEVAAFGFPLMGAEALDSKSLLALRDSESRVELVFQWIMQLVAEYFENGALSSTQPLVSAAEQRMANGLLAFSEAIKISTVPFPFPYTQTCEWLLVLHWIVCPLTVCTWVTQAHWAGLFTFVQVFILWSLNFIASEIENPFGMDANDIDGYNLVEETNRRLLLLISCESANAPSLILSSEPELAASIKSTTSLLETWETATVLADLPALAPARRFVKRGASRKYSHCHRHASVSTIGTGRGSHLPGSRLRGPASMVGPGQLSRQWEGLDRLQTRSMDASSVPDVAILLAASASSPPVKTQDAGCAVSSLKTSTGHPEDFEQIDEHVTVWTVERAHVTQVQHDSMLGAEKGGSVAPCTGPFGREPWGSARVPESPTQMQWSKLFAAHPALHTPSSVGPPASSVQVTSNQGCRQPWHHTTPPKPATGGSSCPRVAESETGGPSWPPVAESAAAGLGLKASAAAEWEGCGSGRMV